MKCPCKDNTSCLDDDGWMVKGVEQREKKKCKCSGINDGFISIAPLCYTINCLLSLRQTVRTTSVTVAVDCVLLYSDTNPLAPGSAAQLKPFFKYNFRAIAA